MSANRHNGLPMPIRPVLAAALAAVFVFAAPILHADAAVKPIPTPDLSKLPLARAQVLKDARAEFDKIRPTLAGDPLVEAYALIGSSYAREGFYDEAAVALDDAALLGPSDGRWVYAQGIIARAQKREAVAQNYFELAFGLDKKYLPIRMAIARSKFNNGDLDGARALLADYLVNHNDQAAPYALLGEIALRQKHYADAIEQTRRALAIDPKATKLYATLADALDGVRDAKGAAEARAKAGDLDVSVADPLAQGLLGGGPALPAAAPAAEVTEAVQALALRRYDVARLELDKVLKQQPNDATVLALYARVEAAAGDLAAAKSRAAAAVAADPSSPLAHLSQGIALEMSADDNGARRAYEQAVRNDAKLVQPRMLLGSLLMRTGEADASVAQFRALVQLDFGNREAWRMLVAADVVSGHCSAALRDVSDVLAKDADNKFLLQLFVRLASTCPTASADQRRGALEYGSKLYRDNMAPPVAEAYALALAANGKWSDAVTTQQAAMFLLVRDGIKSALPPYREFLQQFQAHKIPDHPWPASAAIFHPLRLAPDPKPVAAAPAPEAPKK